MRPPTTTVAMIAACGEAVARANCEAHNTKEDMADRRHRASDSRFVRSTPAGWGSGIEMR